ncbi:glycoside hydrolase superfamily [Aspergillus aurantiobrunneus]
MRSKSPIHYASQLLFLSCLAFPTLCSATAHATNTTSRERIRLRSGWKFQHFATAPDGITYSLRPDNEHEPLQELRDWILPVANEFIANPDQHYKAPGSEPPVDIKYVADDFDDGNWTSVTVPHDWAIAEDFVSDDEVSGDMGRLPVKGVGWYRRSLDFPDGDRNSSIFLDVDGAMSFAMVWLNGHLVGGWPYGYLGFRVDLTPYVRYGEENHLAIRAENPQTRKFSRWYPGAGIYRDVWVTKVARTHVGHYGADITTSDVSADSAALHLAVTVDNDAEHEQLVKAMTTVYEYKSGNAGPRVAMFPIQTLHLPPGQSQSVNASTIIKNPSLWGPPPTQEPNLYIAITELYDTNNRVLDQYETPFGIRTLAFTPQNGLLVNNEPIPIQGVNQHHDLGALGAAWNRRAATRQLEIVRDLGVNAIRTAHNPPAPELLSLTDELGFLVLDEIFDAWAEGKSDSDFHLIFNDWHEADVRSFVRRDRHHPSVIAWSVGNEVPEQTSNTTAAGTIMSTLRSLVHAEDPTRPVTASLNRPVANDPITSAMDIIGLNYQGEGVRYGEAYTHLNGTRTPPQYDTFHTTHPDSLILGSEIAWSLSSRGTFHFPVSPYISAPVNDTNGGGNSSTYEISAYEVYSSEAGSAPDRVFRTQDTKPFVAGGFVWAGFDYLGEPYPYDGDDDVPRSAYSGIVDTAGFKKERFYLYQSRWRSELPAARIVPHWNWPAAWIGRVTPVHVFTSGDEAELFVNGESQGRKKRVPLTYRFRWDEVVYEPGEVRVVVYREGERWATDSVVTTGDAVGLRLSTDQATIDADGEDLAFVTVEVVDAKGDVVPTADNEIQFSVSGPGVIVATDNGFPADLTRFSSSVRNAFSGLALAIVRSEAGEAGSITVQATSGALEGAEVVVTAI